MVNKGGTERRSSLGEFAFVGCALPTGSGERVGLGGSGICSGVTNDSVIMMALGKLSAEAKSRAHAASRYLQARRTCVRLLPCPLLLILPTDQPNQHVETETRSESDNSTTQLISKSSQG